VPDLRQTYRENRTALGLFFRYAPAKVNVENLDATLSEPPAELRKSPFRQNVALLLHVPEGRGYEDADDRHYRLDEKNAAVIRSD